MTVVHAPTRPPAASRRGAGAVRTVAVLGSTGGTGPSVVDLALRRGHAVLAAARDPLAVPPRDRLTTVRVDVSDDDRLDAAIAGSDAVISALGIGKHRHATEVYSRGTRLVIEAMLRHRVPRLVLVSTSSLQSPPLRRPLEWFTDRCVLQPLLRRPYGDMRLMEDLVRESGLDWTLLRAARLTDGPATGRYRVGADFRLPAGWSISRRDLAAAALDLALSSGAARRELHIAY